jgi:hypothetical protein
MSGFVFPLPLLPFDEKEHNFIFPVWTVQKFDGYRAFSGFRFLTPGDCSSSPSSKITCPFPMRHFPFSFM